MKKILVLGIFIALFGVGSVQAEEKVRFTELRKQTKEEFRVKIQNVKDERKKQLVIKLNDQMCAVKKRRVEVLTKNLTTMKLVTDKLTEKLDGKSNDAVTAAVKAQGEAKTAVDSLAAKACGVTLSGVEGKIKSEVRAANTSLEADVKLVHEKIKNARKLTSEAIRSVARQLKEPIPAGVKE